MEKEGTGETQELVSIPDASDDDLLSFLKAEPAPEQDDGPEPKETEEEQTEVQETEEVPVTAAEQKPAEAPKPAEDKKDPEKLQADLVRAQEALKQQEYFIQRRGTEIGQLRREKKELQTQLEALLEEKKLDSPREARQIEKALDKNEAELEQLDFEEVEMRRRFEAQQTVLRHINPGDVNVEDMAAVLAEDDNIDPKFVEQFKRDPFGVDGVYLVNLAKRAQAKKELGEARSILQKVVAYAKQLEAENKSLKGKPEQVLRDIQTAVKRPPSINASTGAPTKAKPATLSQKDLASLPYEELQALLK